MISAYEEKQADRSPPVLLLRTKMLLKQLLAFRNYGVMKLRYACDTLPP